MDQKIVVVAHNVRSSHNVGSLLRTCEGIGVEKVILSGYSPYPAGKNDIRLPHIARKVDAQIDKTALGAQKFQQWQYEQNIDSVIKTLSDSGYIVCALEQSPDSIDLNKFKAPNKIALIVGNEVSGLDKEILKRVNHVLEIPMSGRKESFNVAVAAAMALYAFRFTPEK